MSRSLEICDDVSCPECHGDGEVIHCGWCEVNAPHDSCDDSYRTPCYKLEEREDFDPSGLRLGLYKVFWLDGSYSIASVGQTHSGQRWMAPCNWTGREATSCITTKAWERVKSVEPIFLECDKY